MSKKKRVGILGGSFNPIHIGHIYIAKAAIKACELECVLFMPNGSPAYKDALEVSDKDREQMVKLALADHPLFSYSDIEISTGQMTYTAKTLTLLRELHPDWEIYYIVGSDVLVGMQRWYQPEVIFSKANIVAACRNKDDLSRLAPYQTLLQERFDANIRFIVNEIIPVSSTMIRNRIKSNMSIEGLVPAAVEKYILDRGLYHGK